MKVTVKLIGSFVETLGFSEKELDVPAGTTVGALKELLSLEGTRPMIVTRNGRAISEVDVVDPGDRVVVSPVYSGG